MCCFIAIALFQNTLPIYCIGILLIINLIYLFKDVKLYFYMNYLLYTYRSLSIALHQISG